MPTEEKFTDIMDEQKRLAAREDRIMSVAQYPDYRIKKALEAVERLAPYREQLYAADEKYGFPPGTMIAQAAVESGGWPKNITGTNRSSAGAAGIAQFLPGTARDMGLRVDEEVDERMDPRKAILAGAKYLSLMQEKSGGNLQTALAKYNWGPGSVRGWERGKHTMPDETRDYIGVIPTVRELIQTPEEPKV